MCVYDKDIQQLQLLSFVCDCLNKTAPVFFHDYFTPNSERPTYNTRLASRGDLLLERKNTFQYGIRSIEYNDARLWNMLPVALRESSSPSVFRSDLKNTSYICIPVKLFQYNPLLKTISSNPLLFFFFPLLFDVITAIFFACYMLFYVLVFS